MKPISRSLKHFAMAQAAAFNRTKSRRAFDSKLQKLTEGDEESDDATGTTAAGGRRTSGVEMAIRSKEAKQQRKESSTSRPRDPYNVPKGRAKTGPVQESVFVNMQPLHFDECPHDEAQYGGLSPRRSLNVLLTGRDRFCQPVNSLSLPVSCRCCCIRHSLALCQSYSLAH